MRKKEKHPVYGLFLSVMILLLLLGIALLVMGLQMGGDRMALNSWTRM